MFFNLLSFICKFKLNGHTGLVGLLGQGSTSPPAEAWLTVCRRFNIKNLHKHGFVGQPLSNSHEVPLQKHLTKLLGSPTFQWFSRDVFWQELCRFGFDNISDASEDIFLECLAAGQIRCANTHLCAYTEHWYLSWARKSLATATQTRLITVGPRLVPSSIFTRLRFGRRFANGLIDKDSFPFED